jgi:hypothetical protein
MPARWAEWLANAAKGKCAPVDYVVGWFLPVVGAMLANVRRPKPKSDWEEPSLVWTAMVGEPSSGRSPAWDAIAPLVAHIEAIMSAGHDEAMRIFQAEKLAAKYHCDKWEAVVAEAAADGEPLPPKPSNAEEPKAPVRWRLMMNDATIEAVSKLASDLPRGLLLNRDELAGWLSSMGQYKVAANADRTFWLECYGGRRRDVDRKQAGSYGIPRLSVGVTGGIQPDRLPALTTGGDDGLPLRFLYFWPSVLPKFDMSDSVPDPWAIRAFEKISALEMSNDDDGVQPRWVPFSDPAKEVLIVFVSRVQSLMDNSFGLIKGNFGKAKGHAIRLATILEYLHWSTTEDVDEPEYISVASLTAAIRMLEEYFFPMAERVYSHASIPENDRLAIMLIRYLRQHKIQTFNARILRRHIGGDFREASAMTDALVTLEQACLVRADPSRSGATSGRQKANYQVNPALFR